MTDSEILKLELPEITLEDVFQAQAADYSKRSPSQKVIDMHHKIMEEAKDLISPTAVLCEIAVKSVGENQLILEDGHTLNSELLVKVANTAEKVLLFISTIGIAIEDRAAEYKKAGKRMEAFVCDPVGTAYSVISAYSTIEKIQKQYHDKGFKTTFPLRPGHSYWTHREDMKTIFKILRPERIGIELTESNLIIPFKSIAMVVGIGKDLPDLNGKTNCDFCTMNDRCRSKNGTVAMC
ncbi:Vitamin B12 dependent methionine synthase activation subunit [Phosphitispora sp. TUW77]|uniref:Vitamin B12 dependent methionine synthase activation subunit n=1 Tax=Phosphitispora sp. TUW77 TaxID=3152361 RepID=UPI003AB55556